MQKLSIFHLFIFEIQSILDSRVQNGQTHFWPCPSKNFYQLLIFVSLYQHAKVQSIPSVYSWDAVNFRVQRLDRPHPFFIMLNQKISDLFLIFVNLYHHAKNEAISSICSEEMIDLKIQQSDWPILCLFSQFWGQKRFSGKSG